MREFKIMVNDDKLDHDLFVSKHFGLSRRQSPKFVDFFLKSSLVLWVLKILIFKFWGFFFIFKLKSKFQFSIAKTFSLTAS